MAEPKKLNLALQGGGAHGAYTWGVLDRLLEEPGFEFTAVSGTSAGAMNAVVMAEGLLEGGPEQARLQLEQFWLGIAAAADRLNPFRQWPGYALIEPFLFEASMAATRMLSPYDVSASDNNPLRQALLDLIDFEKVRRQRRLKLFINTTHVATGGLRCWREHELTVEMVLASACLPSLFHTPMIDGEGYWDGGYIANPAIEPMMRATDTDDVLIVQLNPIVRTELPKKATDILERLSEISFNASLVTELRFLAERNRLIANGELSPEKHRRTHLHMVHGDRALEDLPSSSKLLADRTSLLMLRDRGREAASEWIERHAAQVGQRSTFNYRRLVSQLTQDSDEMPDPQVLRTDD